MHGDAEELNTKCMRQNPLHRQGPFPRFTCADDESLSRQRQGPPTGLQDKDMPERVVKILLWPDHLSSNLGFSLG